MVAASRSGSTSAVMRLSSPICSTLSSQASRSLELAPLVTFMSMMLSPLNSEPPARERMHSIDRHLCVLDHPAPLRRLLADHVGELVRPALDRLERVGSEELFLECRIRQDALHVGVDLRHDLWRRPFWCEQAEPGERVETRDARFVDGGHVGEIARGAGGCRCRAP